MILGSVYIDIYGMLHSFNVFFQLRRKNTQTYNSSCNFRRFINLQSPYSILLKVVANNCLEMNIREYVQFGIYVMLFIMTVDVQQSNQ